MTKHRHQPSPLLKPLENAPLCAKHAEERYQRRMEDLGPFKFYRNGHEVDHSAVLSMVEDKDALFRHLDTMKRKKLYATEIELRDPATGTAICALWVVHDAKV